MVQVLRCDAVSRSSVEVELRFAMSAAEPHRQERVSWPRAGLRRLRISGLPAAYGGFSCQY